jgi:hypothetical protein
MRRIETLFIALALAFYVWFLNRLGPADIFAHIKLVGWGIGTTIGLEAVARVLNTLGWRVTIADYPRELSFMRLFQARIAGEAIDYITPSAQLGGQFLMAVMVRRKLRIALGLASVFVAAMAEAIGQIGFMSGALLISMRLASAFSKLFWPVMGGLAIAIALAAVFFVIQMKRPFSMLWRFAARINFTAAATDELKAGAAEADELLADFYRNHRVRLLLSCLCYLMAWSMGPIEIYILLKFLNQPATWQAALLVEALGQLIERATFLIPAKLVSQEGGKALIVGVLGYPAGIGFVIGFLRRVKEMVWVLFGLAALMEHRLFEERNGRIANARAAHDTIELDGVEGRRTI